MAKTASKQYPTDTTSTETQPLGETPAQPTDEEIAMRAYYIFLEHGGATGSPEDDWLQAERELTETSAPQPGE